MIIAATIALLLVTSGIATIATDKEIKNSAVTFYENHIRVHFNRSKDTDTISGIKIATELKKHGIADLKLPSIFSQMTAFMKIWQKIMSTTLKI